jgi:hypothetical protein
MIAQVVADGENIGAAEAAAAMDPAVGDGTPQSAPLRDLADELPLTDRQPVRVLGVAQSAVAAGAAVALGAPRRAALPIAAGLYLLSELAARRVTPLARPRDAQGDPLTP